MRNIHGCGIGLRSEFLESFIKSESLVDWIEITPENWFQIPQRFNKDFEKAMALYPVVAHGVSLSIGSLTPLDRGFLKKMKTFLDRYHIEHYSEHLSFSASSATQTYELLPLPMTYAMIKHLCERIDQVQDMLERPLILENASYYIAPYSEMREVDFVCEVLEKSNTRLLLDVNNVYVNSINHAFDAQKYIAQIPAKRVAYMHVAGHLHYPQEDLLLDTHGEAVCEAVWTLLQKTLKTHNAPVMIERDNNIPPFEMLMQEFALLRDRVGEI